MECMENGIPVSHEILYHGILISHEILKSHEIKFQISKLHVAAGSRPAIARASSR